MNWALLLAVGLGLWALVSTFTNAVMGVSMYRLDKLLKSLKERLGFFEKSHREVANIRQSVRALNQDRQNLKDLVRELKDDRAILQDRIMELEATAKEQDLELQWLGEVLEAYKSLDREEEVEWLKAVLSAHGLGHILERKGDSPLWEITGCPKPPTKK